MPNGHALVKTHHPSGNKVIGHVLNPGLDHLSDLPEFVAVCWKEDISEDETLCNCQKPLLPHVPLEVVWVGAFLLRFWDGVVVPILFGQLPLKHQHQDLHPNELNELTEREWCHLLLLKLRTHLHQQNGLKPRKGKEVGEELEVGLVVR